MEGRTAMVALDTEGGGGGKWSQMSLMEREKEIEGRVAGRRTEGLKPQPVRELSSEVGGEGRGVLEGETSKEIRVPVMV